MIVGLGIDVVEVGRIAKARQHWGERFLRRVFTDGELGTCLASAHCDQRLASRFAAKEAALKALGTGLALGARWLDVEVVKGERGEPSLRLWGAAKDRLGDVAGRRVSLSLTHSGDVAAAVVIIES